MNKRLFRRDPAARTEASYPTVDEFDGNRREFLARFGATILGAGALAATAGCGDNRAVPVKPDMNRPPGGAPSPDSQVDQYGGPSGVAPSADARVDMPLLGDVNDPDARIDKKDQGLSPGFAPNPDAKVDKKDGMMAGGAPMPDAKVDKKDIMLSGAAPMPDAAGDKKKK